MRKKKGSSLVMVVIITAMIFTLATTMIAMVTGDYRARINESKELQNLYQSESGLDLVYNVITKNSDAATEYANKKVFDYIESDKVKKSLIQNDDSEINNIINEKFKENFIKFLGNHADTDEKTNFSDLIDDPADKTAKNPKVIPNSIKDVDKDKEFDFDNTSEYENTLIYGILNLKYAYYAAKDGSTENVAIEAGNINWKPIERKYDNDKQQQAEIKILSYSVDNAKKRIVIEVESTFQTNESANPNFLSNKKTIKTKYVINAPDYSENFGINADVKYVDMYAPQKAIVADGNLNAEGAGTINVNGGDVWIQGRDTNLKQDAYSFDKYRSGIFISDGQFNVNDGIVATNGTFNLGNKATSNVNNLYSVNTYLGKKSATDSNVDESKIVANKIVTNNDLAFNAGIHSSIKASEYYGINDKTIDGTIDPSIAALQSSSIIVNNENNGTRSDNAIDIDKAIVCGVAYVETDKNYKTGESIAVMGNYAAYEYIFPGDENKYKLVQHSSGGQVAAQFIENKDGSNLSTTDKANYFTNYYNNVVTGKKFSFNNGGVKIGDLKSVGASVTVDGIKNFNITVEEASKEINKYKNEYAKYVYGMGLDTSYESNTSATPVNTVSNQINFGFTPYISTDHKGSLTGFKVAKGDLILNNDISKNVYVKQGKIIVGTDDTENEDGSNVVNYDNDSTIMIVTNGDVIIGDGSKDIDFNGSIISGSDVNFVGTGNKNINYNQGDLFKVGAKYYNELGYNDAYNNEKGTERVFNGEPISKLSTDREQILTKIINNQKSYEDKDPTSGSKSDYTTISAKYDANQYLKKGLWQLVKNNADTEAEK